MGECSGGDRTSQLRRVLEESYEPGGIPEFKEISLNAGIKGISSEVYGQERPELWVEARSNELYNQLINISKRLLDDRKPTIDCNKFMVV